MHEHQEDDPEVLSEIEKLGYDPRDVPVDKTWQHAVALYVGVAAAMVVAWGVMALIDRNQGSTLTGSKHGEVAARTNMPEEPFPLIQSNRAAHEDVKELRHEERLKTETYSWVDKENGVARIPVDQAIADVLRDGMPVTNTDQVPASTQPSPTGTVTR